MKNKKDKTYDLLGKTYRNFILKVVLITLMLPLFGFGIAVVGAIFDFQWVYDISPSIYEFFYIIAMPDSIFSIFIYFIIWIIIVLILLYRLLKKVFSYLKALEDASNQLFDKSVDFIELPEELEDIQSKMNLLKMTSERNEKLALENEMKKNDLVVYLAHDLKTPLTSMIGYLSLIDEISDMPKKKREKYVKIALEKSYKLEDLINELFDITRFNAETIVLEKVLMDLNIMIEQIIDDFYPILNELDKRIEYKKSDKITIVGDPDRLYRVFNNLIKNAINYSTDKVINIETKTLGDKVIVIISNKAVRMSKEKLNRLFEKFYRGDSSRTSKTGGSGLGLAIAKEIVELHGGSIKAESEDDVIKFYVVLPILDS